MPKERMTSAEYQKYMSRKKTRNKYGNKSFVKNGIRYASTLEYNHWLGYQDMLKKGEIAQYEFQKRFVLQDGFIENGKKIRAITYIADHYIVHNDGQKEVIDSKGVETQNFRNKRKMFKLRYTSIKFTTRFRK